MNPDLLPLNEVFGPTFQGEGPHTGRRCYFVRLGLCNLSCAWCDTPYTWDASRYDLAKENPEMDPEVILSWLEDLGAILGDTVVLSGGEPLMHHARPAFRELLNLGGLYEWHVETNGTIAPPEWWIEHVAHTTVSPKVAQDDDPRSKRLKVKPLAAWAELAHKGRAAFKFVVRADLRYLEHDLTGVLRVTEELDLCDAHVYVMPEGTDAVAVVNGMRTIAPAVEASGWNLSTRLHTLLWDDERGR